MDCVDSTGGSIDFKMCPTIRKKLFVGNNLHIMILSW